MKSFAKSSQVLLIALAFFYELASLSYGQAEKSLGIREFEIAPKAIYQAYDYLTGDLAVIDANSLVHVYSRGFFAGDPNLVRGPSEKLRAIPESISIVQTPEKTWIAVGSRHPEHTLIFLDSKSVKIEHSVSVNLAASGIRVLTPRNLPGYDAWIVSSEPLAWRLNLQTMKPDIYLLGTTFQSISSRNLFGYRPGGAFWITDKNAEAQPVIVPNVNTNASTIIADHRERLCASGTSVYSSDMQDVVGNFSFNISDFSAQFPLVAGINSQRTWLGIGSLETKKMLTRIPLSKQLLDARTDDKSPVQVFFDDTAKQILISRRNIVGVVDFGGLSIPDDTYRWATIDAPEIALIGQTYEAKVVLPADARLEIDSSLQNVAFEDGILRWKVRANELGLKTFKIRHVDSEMGERFFVRVQWPCFPISFRDAGIIADADLKSENRLEPRDPRPEGLAVDDKSIALWFQKSLLVLDVETGAVQWSHRFEQPIFNVVFGTHHIYTELINNSQNTGNETLVVMAIARNKDYAIKPVESLRTETVYQFQNKLKCQFVDGYIARNILHKSSAAVLVDETLLPAPTLVKPTIEYGRIIDHGIEYSGFELIPQLIRAAPSFAASVAGELTNLSTPYQGGMLEEESKRLSDFGISQLEKPTVYQFTGIPIKDRNVPSAALDIHRYATVNHPQDRRIKRAPISPIPQAPPLIQQRGRTIFYAMRRTVFKISVDEIDLPEPNPLLTIEPRQSTFVANTSTPTDLSYRIFGGIPPYTLQGPCWLGGQKPKEILPQSAKLEAGMATLSFTPQELKIAIQTYFA